MRIKKIEIQTNPQVKYVRQPAINALTAPEMKAVTVVKTKFFLKTEPFVECLQAVTVSICSAVLT